MEEFPLFAATRPAARKDQRSKEKSDRDRKLTRLGDGREGHLQITTT
jgi:hypothetical protein